MFSNIFSRKNEAAGEPMPKDFNEFFMKSIMDDRNKERNARNIRMVLLMLFFTPTVFIFGMYVYFMSKSVNGDGIVLDDDRGYVSMVRLDGSIGGGSGVSAMQFNKLLELAFKDEKAKGVVLVINSPGGSPVQSALIRNKLVELKNKNTDKPLIVYGEDTMASGGYLIATGSNKIFTDQATITGSIGVIMDSVGITDALKKIGVEPRIYTAGTNKARMNPMKEVRPQDVEKFNDVLGTLHKQFITFVKDGRGDRLKGDEAELFSGDFWPGETAAKLGLIDGTSDLSSLLVKEYGTDAVFEYRYQPTLMEYIKSGVGVMAGEFARSAMDQVAAQPQMILRM
jgi:protease-4